MRTRFRLPRREITPSDHLVVARSANRSLALMADRVSGVIECDDDHLAVAAGIVPGLEFIEGVARCDDGLVLIHDLDRFLSLEEDDALARALEACDEE